MRLIDKDALITQIETNICKPCKDRKYDYHGVRCRACQYGDEINDIDSAPTIEERKKGEWNTDKESPEYATCSVCGHCDWDCTESEYFNFCPNCGAEMERRNQ